MNDPIPWNDMGVSAPNIDLPFSVAAAVVLGITLVWMIKHEGTDWPGVLLGMIFGVLVAQTLLGDAARIIVSKGWEIVTALIGVFS